MKLKQLRAREFVYRTVLPYYSRLLSDPNPVMAAAAAVHRNLAGHR